MEQEIKYKENVNIFFSQKETIIFNKAIEEIIEECEQQLQLNSQQIKWLQIQSQVYYKYEQKHKQSLNIIKKILSIDQFNVDARLDLINILMSQNLGSINDKEKLFGECFEIDQQYWRTYFVHSQQYDTQYNEQKALNTLFNGLERNPGNIWILCGISQFYSLKTNQKENVKNMLNQVFTFENLDYELFRRIAFVLLHQNKISDAENCLMHSLKLNPKSTFTQICSAYFYQFYKKDSQKCIEYCEKAKGFFGSQQSTIFYTLASAYDSLNQEQECIEYYTKSTKFNPKNPQPFVSLYNKLYRQDRLNQAQYIAQKSQKLFPHDIASFTLQIFSIVRQDQQTENIDYEQYEQVIFKLLNQRKKILPPLIQQQMIQTINKIFDFQ